MPELRSQIDRGDRGGRGDQDRHAINESIHLADDGAPVADMSRVERGDQGDFVPDDEQLRAAIQKWDEVNLKVEKYVNHAGLLDMDDPEQAQLSQELEVAEDTIRARLTELGYQNVRFLINVFFYENNKNPEEFPDGHYSRI